MKKRFLALLLLALLAAAVGSGEEAPFCLPVEEGGAQLTVTVSETGENVGDAGEKWMEAAVRDGDGALLQTLRYQATELAAGDYGPGPVWTEDLNFDGHPDLCFWTVPGARNQMVAFALWNVEKGCFDPVYQDCPWLTEENRYADGLVQLELSNYVLYPEKKMILTVLNDGAAWYTARSYTWEGERSLHEAAVASVYGAENGKIGEKVELFATGILRCWDQTLPETWYFSDRVQTERRQVLEDMLTAFGEDAAFATVTVQTDLYGQDGADAPAVAVLPAGSAVQVLRTGCGAEENWVRVWVAPEDGSGVFVSREDDGSARLTGYVPAAALNLQP